MTIQITDDEDDEPISAKDTSNEIIILDDDDDDDYEYKADSRRRKKKILETSDSEDAIAITSRKSPRIKRKKKVSSPPDLIIIDDNDTQLPEIQDLNNSENNETFMSTNDDHTFNNISIPSTPNLANSSIHTPNVESSSFNDLTSQQSLASLQIHTPNAIYSSSTSQNSIYDNIDAQFIDQDFCLKATRTLSKQQISLGVSTSISATSISSTASSTPGRKRKMSMPSYNSTKNFNPKISFSMSIFNDDNDKVDVPSTKKVTHGENYSVKNSVSSTFNTVTNVIVEKKKKKYNDFKLNVEPRVVVLRLSEDEILNYIKSLKVNSGKFFFSSLGLPVLHVAVKR
jgi:hypothetical protein